MDPYLERHWGDVRTRMTVYIAEALSALLPDALCIRTEENIFIEEGDDNPCIERWNQILNVSSGEQLVTAIEVLTPDSKGAGKLNDRYRQRLKDYQQAGVSVVEIDLLRGTRERLSITQDDLPAKERKAYVVCVRKGWLPGRWEAYPISLRAPIPPVPVPLRRGESHVRLELQPSIDRIYAIGRYDDIDYSKPPVPSLNLEDEAWADGVLRQAGRR